MSSRQDDFSDDSDSHSAPTSSNRRRIRPPVDQGITGNFQNAMITEPSFKNLSANAKKLIYSLLLDIEDRFTKSQHSSDIDNPNIQASSSRTELVNFSQLIRQEPSLQDQSTQTDIITSDSILSKLDSIQAQIGELATSTIQQSPHQVLKQPQSTIIITPPSPEDLPKLAAKLQALHCPDQIQITKFKIHPDKLEVRAASESAKQHLKSIITEAAITPPNSIQDKQPRKTKLIFFNVSREANLQGLERAISAKLSIQAPTPVELIREIPSGKQGCVHWVVSLSYRIASLLLNSNFVFSGLKKIYYQKYIYIPRCTRCQEIGTHTASKCTAKEITCSYCSNKHHFSNCRAYLYNCVNCEAYNSVLMDKATSEDDPILDDCCDNRHSSADPNCPSYRMLFNQQIKRSSPSATFGLKTVNKKYNPYVSSLPADSK